MNKASLRNVGIDTQTPPDSRYAGHLIYPSNPSPKLDPMIEGRDKELEFIKDTCGLNEKWEIIPDKSIFRNSFPRIRFEGPSGAGKYSLILKVANETQLPLYEIHGHKGLSPNELVLNVVPKATKESRGEGVPLILKASPLTTALLWGGIFYFNGIHRTSENALAPLASLLDGRNSLYSGVTGLNLKPRPDAKPFIFFCSWDPAELSGLPSFIDQRTLPKLVLQQLHSDIVKHRIIKQVSSSKIQQITDGVIHQKEQLLSTEIQTEIAAFKKMVRSLNVKRINEYIKNNDYINAFKLILEIGSPSQKQRVRLEELKDSIAKVLKLKANSLAAKSNEADCSKAIEIYELLFSSGYVDHDQKNNYAHCLLHCGQLEKGLTEIDEVLRDYNAFAIAWITRGEIMEAKNEISEAIISYKKAISIEPLPALGGKKTNEVALAHLKRLDAV